MALQREMPDIPDLVQPLDAGKYFKVQVPNFEGPFDLLLFFIERDELDIYDIPISRLTQEFMAYLNTLEGEKIEVASEFIIIAAQLMRIKAKMLLPRPQLDETGKPVDPRTELVNRLLEYKRYKDILPTLEAQREVREQQFARGFIAGEEKLLRDLSTPEENLYGLTLHRLGRVYHMTLLRQKYQQRKPQHVIQQYPYTMESVREHLTQRLPLNQRVDFRTLLQEEPTRLYAIFTFLVLLEMAAGRGLHFIVGEGYNQFWVERLETPEPEPLNLDLLKGISGTAAAQA